eukprot:1155679-Pelagomonas_calceolata.AAC.2
MREAIAICSDLCSCSLSKHAHGQSQGHKLCSWAALQSQTTLITKREAGALPHPTEAFPNLICQFS